MNYIKLLQTISETKGAGSKAEIRRLLAEGHAKYPEFWTLVELAMNPYKVFHVKKFSIPYLDGVTSGSLEDLAPFIQLTNLLSSRKVTGNAALELVSETLALYDADTQEWLAKVLKKDLKAGFSAETYNEAVFGSEEAKDGIPLYKCALAKKMTPKYKWKFPCQVDAKYDGQRCNAYVKENVTYLARSGKVMDHVEGLFDEELQKLRSFFGVDIVVDGEVKASDFIETMNAKKSGNKEAKNSLRFYVYDIMSLEEWETRESQLPQADRTSTIKFMITSANGFEKLIAALSKIVHSVEEAKDFYHELVEAGYEGAVVKDLTAHYQWDRSSAWTKWKPVDTFDLEIVGFYPGNPGTKYEHILGGCSVRGTDENGNVIVCNVGSGWSDELRNEIWNNQEKYLGRIIECEADPTLSKIEGREELAMRWGVFKKWREDKDK